MADPITEEQLREWEKLAEEATAGPWHVESDTCHFDSLSSVRGGMEAEWDQKRRCYKGGLSHEVMIEVGGFDASRQEINTRFVARSRTIVPLLIAEVRRLRKEK